ncbi:hypothetical protein EJ04DRAFT_594254 [Polyplosphaeria fusca]|uniref:Uncharacterized protein n=1 Tax=Polyplosphaeria fusca TaxID=682080 RepID=A0A9P4UUZ9_9PLEO|nr:hypothetical protein EJ04DRAFT_594254 [Polyplosphaeria fusca]
MSPNNPPTSTEVVGFFFLVFANFFLWVLFERNRFTDAINHQHAVNERQVREQFHQRMILERMMLAPRNQLQGNAAPSFVSVIEISNKRENRTEGERDQRFEGYKRLKGRKMGGKAEGERNVPASRRFFSDSGSDWDDEWDGENVRAQYQWPYYHPYYESQDESDAEPTPEQAEDLGQALNWPVQYRRSHRDKGDNKDKGDKGPFDETTREPRSGRRRRPPDTPKSFRWKDDSRPDNSRPEPQEVSEEEEESAEVGAGQQDDQVDDVYDCPEEEGLEEVREEDRLSDEEHKYKGKGKAKASSAEHEHDDDNRRKEEDDPIHWYHYGHMYKNPSKSPPGGANPQASHQYSESSDDSSVPTPPPPPFTTPNGFPNGFNGPPRAPRPRSDLHFIFIEHPPPGRTIPVSVSFEPHTPGRRPALPRDARRMPPQHGYAHAESSRAQHPHQRQGQGHRYPHPQPDFGLADFGSRHGYFTNFPPPPPRFRRAGGHGLFFWPPLWYRLAYARRVRRGLRGKGGGKFGGGRERGEGGIGR